MIDVTIRDYIRKRALHYTQEMKRHAAEREATTDGAKIAGKGAAITYCDGAALALDDIMAYIGDGDGRRMLQAERESA